MEIFTKKCRTAISFLNYLSPLRKHWYADKDRTQNSWIFRGQAVDCPLLPSALRKPNPEVEKKGAYIKSIYERERRSITDERAQVGAEYDLLRDFSNAADWQGKQVPNYSMPFRDNMLSARRRPQIIAEYEKWPQRRYRELLGLAQHSRVPTRLLDWSERPYVSAYMAAKEAATVNHENPPDNREDLLDCSKKPCVVVWALNTKTIRRPHNKKSNCPIPIEIIRPTMALNPCLLAQRGLFTLISPETGYEVASGSLENLLEGVVEEDESENLIRKIVLEVPRDRRQDRELLRWLFEFGIHAGTMTPTLDGAAAFAKERLLWPDHNP